VRRIGEDFSDYTFGYIMTVLQFVRFYAIQRDSMLLKRKGTHHGPLQYTVTEFVSTVWGNH
jgi:hypothetical protein